MELRRLMPDNPSGSLPYKTGIGSLRWQVSLYSRPMDADPNSPGMTEDLVRVGPDVHADIQPTYPSTFYGSMQIERPITHLIRLRWLDYLDNVHVVFRTTVRPSDGTFRTEAYRVRRCKELAGRKRFLELEVELEKNFTTAGDSDAERIAVFCENPPASVH
jgi:hypothetical protein